MQLLTFSVLVWTIVLVSAEKLKRGVDQKIITVPKIEFEPRYLLEFSNGTTQWTTEAHKWELKRNGEFFIDTTNNPTLPTFSTQLTHLNTKIQNSLYPPTVSQKQHILPLFKAFSKTNLQTNLETLTSFHNRWYNSTYGQASYRYLLNKVINTISSSTHSFSRSKITVQSFYHLWSKQHSIIVRIPGIKENTIVLGAHQDSVNHADPMEGRAPGADDDGSGTVTILEVLRVLLLDQRIREGGAENTLEFHWYAGEEGGLLGSQDVFESYRKEGRKVKAMLQQDMTGFWNRTVEKEKEFGLMMDAVHLPLMDYMKLIIEEYTEIPWIETGCGPHCGSDHMSAIKAGYPGAFIIEGAFEFTNNHLHGVDDLKEYLDCEHMIDHAKMSLGFVYELAFAKF